VDVSPAEEGGTRGWPVSDSEVFETTCAAIEAHTSLDRLAARGTVRIALKQAGLDARSVAPEQMAVVVEKLLSAELESRGVSQAASVCAELLVTLRAMKGAGSGDTPDAVFRRLAG
jgi:hypothetical protein